MKAPDNTAVRPYQTSDRDAVIALWRRVFPDNPKHNDPGADIDRKMTQDPELFFVAHSGEQLSGTAMGGWDGHRGWVYAAVEIALAERGCHKLNLQVRDGNTAATEFYSALGYSVEARVSMGKQLAP